MSKALPPHKYGATKALLGACLLALRAWIVGKFQENGFAHAKSCRRRLLQGMLHDLRCDIQSAVPTGVMTTGNDDVDVLVRDWAPEALTAP